MKRFSLLFIVMLFVLPSFAQEDEQTPYEIALQRIEEAAARGATELDLSGLGLSELPPKIGGLVEIESLHLEDNQLSSLPLKLASLANFMSFI